MNKEHRIDQKAAIDCITAFAGSTGLGCLLADTKGLELFQTGYNCSVCKICHKAGIDLKRCRQSQNYGLEEAKRFGGKYIYFCPFGLSCFVSPIMNGALSKSL